MSITILKFTNNCHSERSEESKILRFAQDDILKESLALFYFLNPAEGVGGSAELYVGQAVVEFL